MGSHGRKRVKAETNGIHRGQMRQTGTIEQHDPENKGFIV